MKELRRREFIAATVATVAAAGCTGRRDSRLDEFYFDTDLEKAELEVSGEDIVVNLYAHAEDSQGDLEELELQYMEPGSDAWEVLSREDAENGRVATTEPYDPEEPGEYRFRSVANMGRDESYVSDVETVRFVKDMGNDLF